MMPCRRAEVDRESTAATTIDEVIAAGAAQCVVGTAPAIELVVELAAAQADLERRIVEEADERVGADRGRAADEIVGRARCRSADTPPSA